MSRAVAVKLVVLAILAALALMLSGAGAFHFDGSMPARYAVPAINPDPRVHWHVHEVGGMTIQGWGPKGPKWKLPPGTELSIPYPVPAGQGDDPDSAV